MQQGYSLFLLAWLLCLVSVTVIYDSVSFTDLSASKDLLGCRF